MNNTLLLTASILAMSCAGLATVKTNASTTAIAAPVPGQPVDLTVAAERALPCVAHIKYLQNSKVQEVEMQGDPFGDMFDPFGFFGQRGQGQNQKRKVQTPKREGTGSGVIISSDGYIVTNNHVVEGADELTVTLNDNREFSARIIGTDPSTDLALIKVNGKDLPTLPIGDSDKLKVGEWVIAVGNPYGLNNTVTAGIVSAKARSLYAQQNGVESFIQTDAAINPGNSGGALVNTKGELVGINAMLYSQTGSFTGYGFAIPTTIMNKVVSDLKEYGTVQRAYLGITGGDLLNQINALKDSGKDADFGTNEGVYVSKVDPDGAGAEAGLEEGDVIINIDGKKIGKMAELQEHMANKRPGDKLSVTYIHKKKKVTKTVTLKNAQGTTKVVKTADLDVLGGSFAPVNKDTKEQLGINYGLEVIKVTDGPLKKKGIEKGFIILQANDTPIKAINDLQETVKKASTSKDPVLYIKGIWPTGKRDYFAIEVN